MGGGAAARGGRPRRQTQRRTQIHTHTTLALHPTPLRGDPARQARVRTGGHEAINKKIYKRGGLKPKRASVAGRAGQPWREAANMPLMDSSIVAISPRRVERTTADVVSQARVRTGSSRQ